MPDFQGVLCDPGGIRTHDPQLRRLLLYPAELRGLIWAAKLEKFKLLTRIPAIAEYSIFVTWNERGTAQYLHQLNHA